MRYSQHEVLSRYEFLACVPDSQKEYEEENRERIYRAYTTACRDGILDITLAHVRESGDTTDIEQIEKEWDTEVARYWKNEVEPLESKGLVDVKAVKKYKDLCKKMLQRSQIVTVV